MWTETPDPTERIGSYQIRSDETLTFRYIHSKNFCQIHFRNCILLNAALSVMVVMNTNSILSRVLFLTCTWIFLVSVYAPSAISSDTPYSGTEDTTVKPNETYVSKELRGRNPSIKKSDRAGTALKLGSPSLLGGSAALLATGQETPKMGHIPTVFRTAALGAYRNRKPLAPDTHDKKTLENATTRNLALISPSTLSTKSDDLPKLNLAKVESAKKAIREIRPLENAKTSIQEPTSHKNALLELCNSQPNSLRESIEKLIFIPEGVLPPTEHKRAESPFESEYIKVDKADWEQIPQANEPRKEPPKLEHEASGIIDLGAIEWSHFREN